MEAFKYVNTQNENDIVTLGQILDRYVDINETYDGFEDYVNNGFRDGNEQEYRVANDRLMRSDKVGEGYYFISKNNLPYQVLEGMAIGGIERNYTSDIGFILLDSCDYNVSDLFVGYFYGTTMIESRKKEYEETIREMVDTYEQREFSK